MRANIITSIALTLLLAGCTQSAERQGQSNDESGDADGGLFDIVRTMVSQPECSSDRAAKVLSSDAVINNHLKNRSFENLVERPLSRLKGAVYSDVTPILDLKIEKLRDQKYQLSTSISNYTDQCNSIEFSKKEENDLGMRAGLNYCDQLIYTDNDGIFDFTSTENTEGELITNSKQIFYSKNILPLKMKLSKAEQDIKQALAAAEKTTLNDWESSWLNADFEMDDVTTVDKFEDNRIVLCRGNLVAKFVNFGEYYVPVEYTIKYNDRKEKVSGRLLP